MPSFTVYYTALKFEKTKNPITEGQFTYFKQEIQKDKNFRFHRYTTYFSYNKSTILSIVILAAICWGSWQYIDGADWERQQSTIYDVLTGTCILSGFICFYQTYVWAAKNSSYINYRKDVKSYYEGMKAAIVNSDSYPTFVKTFYGE
ncbi:MAG: hypothetical protein KGO82_09100 [Bacteroidota bacterium]|nr:hypothetical protein [Bacteroidota bacterium]